jgi:hypothetical protein
MDDASSAEGITCTECNRAPGEDGSAEVESWRFLPTDVHDPHPFCPECAEREFGPSR